MTELVCSRSYEESLPPLGDLNQDTLHENKENIEINKIGSTPNVITDPKNETEKFTPEKSNEDPIKANENLIELHVNSEKETDDEEDSVQKKNSNKKQKRRFILDSDNEDQDILQSQDSNSNDLNKSMYIRNDDDKNEDESSPTTRVKTSSVELEPTKMKLSKEQISSLIDSDSEMEEEHLEIPKEASNSNDKENRNSLLENVNKKFSNIIDSESSNSENEEEFNDRVKDENILDEELPKGKMEHKRLRSKKVPPTKGPDSMKAIKSETQRLARETYISIPYHKPKRRTLREFMERRTVKNPEELILNRTKNPKLKMSTEELENYAKHLEERAKEADNFFKSESENEDELDNKDNSEVIHSDNAQEELDAKENQLHLMELAEESNAADVEKMSQPLEINDDVVQNVGDKQNEDFETKMDALLNNVDEGPKELICTDTNQQINDMETHDKLLNEDSNSQSHTALEKESCRSKANVKKIIEEMNDLPKTPRIKGDSDMVIDLENGQLFKPAPTGLDCLLEKFCRNLKNNAKGKSSTLTAQNEVKGNSLIASDNHKPGASYLELKNKLRAIITEKRKEELNKRLAESHKLEKNDETEEDFAKCKDDYEEMMEVHEENEDSNNEDNVLDEETDFNEEEELLEDNNEEDKDDLDDDEADNETDSEDDCLHSQSVKRKTKRLRRISKFSEDSDDEENDLCIDKDINDVEEENDANNTSLWENEGSNSGDPEMELLGLCSGKFDPTQKNIKSATNQNARTEEILTASDLHKDSNKNTFSMGLENETPPEEKNKLQSNEIIEDLGEDDNIKDEISCKKLVKNKGEKRLGFSDDEEDIDDQFAPEESNESRHSNDDNVLSSGEMEQDLPVESDEEVETFIDYDSEENEIEVHLTKKEKLMKMKDFLEKEAELSESEWGSADEDERGFDRYDIEVGDEDKFDKDQLKEELEKIHMRKILDDDIRQVKKLKEIFLTEEEIEETQRQRRFKWKNIELNGEFNLNSTEQEENDEKAESDNEENEILWRKMRYERSLLIKDGNDEAPDKVLPTIANENNSSFNISKKVTLLKGNRKSSETGDEEKIKLNSPFLISKTNKTTIRGSFLVRDAEILSKLATVTRLEADSADGVARPTKAGKFVFTTIEKVEEPVKQITKRPQSAISQGNLNEQGEQQKKKKRKISIEKRLIDHLL